jgi:dolichol-phosphate mannosyltransferase
VSGASSWLPAALWALAVGQGLALLVLLGRLLPGRSRRPPVAPSLAPRGDTSVTAIVATLNEVTRVGPCLEGLMAQPAPLTEILVVDSRSTDGTRDLVQAAAARDPRVRLLTDDPLPPGWVGKVWALETGLRQASGTWVLGIDADTEPKPGMLPALVDAAEALGYDVVSFGPRFAGQTAAERFVQPAMLLTLVYRCGAAGATDPAPDRVMANGQCFLSKRAVLEAHGGYTPARASWCDDVTLARHIAARGGRVGFLDGSRVIDVRAYTSLGEMWREWGRSFDLKDATPVWRRWADVALVWAIQALPLPLLLALAVTGAAPALLTPDRWGAPEVLVLINGLALLIRLLMLPALRASYAEGGWPFWASFLADVPAAVRLTLSTARPPKAWRGRAFRPLEPAT